MLTTKIGRGCRLKPSGSIAAPTAELYADWQPHAIAGSDTQRPYLDGEPIAGAIVASTYMGWVLVSSSQSPIEKHARFEIRPGGTCRIYGRVELHAVKRGY